MFARAYWIGAGGEIVMYDLPGIPQWLNDVIFLHEHKHSLGIIRCRKPWCLMWEGTDSWWLKHDTLREKLVAPLILLHRLVTGQWCCKEHKE